MFENFDLAAVEKLVAMAGVLCVAIVVGYLIITIIRTREDLRKSWIFKPLILTEFIAILMLINFRLDIKELYFIISVVTVVMFIYVTRTLTKQSEQAKGP